MNPFDPPAAEEFASCCGVNLAPPMELGVVDSGGGVNSAGAAVNLAVCLCGLGQPGFRAAHVSRCRRLLVLRNGGVDFVGPGRDAAGEVVDLFEAVAGEEFRGALAAATRFAMDDNL